MSVRVRITNACQQAIGCDLKCIYFGRIEERVRVWPLLIDQEFHIYVVIGVTVGRIACECLQAKFGLALGIVLNDEC